ARMSNTPNRSCRIRACGFQCSTTWICLNRGSPRSCLSDSCVGLAAISAADPCGADDLAIAADLVEDRPAQIAVVAVRPAVGDEAVVEQEPVVDLLVRRL